LHVRLDVAPRQRPLTQRHAAGEPGADSGDGAPGREALEGRDGSRLCEHVTQTRDEDGGPEPDSVGALGDARQRDPHVRVQRGGVVHPDPLETEGLGEHGLLDDVGPRWERARDVHRDYAFASSRWS
jgi:hypothetical protein